MPSLDFLNHPLSLMLVVVLSVASTVFCWTGFKDKNVVHLLWGFGLAIPTFDVGDYRLWLVGLGMCGLGYWLKEKWDSI